MTRRRITPPPSRSARLLALAAALVAAPLGSAGLAAQGPTPPAPPPARDSVVAAPDSTVRDSMEVTRVARRHAGAVRSCYQEQGLKSDPMLRGLLHVELTVLPSGEIEAAAATATDVGGEGMPSVVACVAAAARAWRFRDGATRADHVVLEYALLPPSP